MFRYVALVWDTQNEQQSAAAELLTRRVRALSGTWHAAFDKRGMRVFCADIQPRSLEPHLLPNTAGVILGTLFARSRDVGDASPCRKALPSAEQTEAILASHGRWLIENCWGNYVAFLVDRVGDRKWILKDPTGNLPCFSTVFEHVTVIFSSIADCVELRAFRFTINRSYLNTRVVGGSQDLQQNPLNEVEQIRRGECVELDPTADPAVRSRRFHWDPLAFAGADDLIEDPTKAADAMRATVRACTHSWAACHDSVLHRLSGGLDSSIIAGCLADAPTRPRILCYTYYNPRGRSDERPWARLAAEHTHCEHTECSTTPADVDLVPVLQSPPFVEPTPVMGYILRNTLERRLASDRAATAVFNGDGGDSGFCSESISYAVAEYLRLHGVRPEAFRLASQVARRTDRSSWAVLLNSVRQWLLGTDIGEHSKMVLMVSRLVSRELMERVAEPARFPHPWFSHFDRVPWVTIRRVGMLLATPEFYNVDDPAGSAPEVVSPLYSQPAIELFLRIPIHVHFEDGRDRGLARRAFEREVPQPILRRLWKDRAPGFYDELVHRNCDFLREIFLDGVLVREGLLDRDAIEKTLSDKPVKSDVLPTEFFKHLDVEIWARRWT